MSAFRVSVVAVNPKNETIVTEPIEALVDTGSELTWLPAAELTAIGITPRRKRTFVTASGERLQREIGYAIVRAEGYETTDEVVFGRRGDQVLLGVRTLEGFAVTVDPVGHRLVAQATLACRVARYPSRPVQTIVYAFTAGGEAPTTWATLPHPAPSVVIDVQLRSRISSRSISPGRVVCVD